jgi:hypothetical protein
MVKSHQPIRLSRYSAFSLFIFASCCDVHQMWVQEEACLKIGNTRKQCSISCFSQDISSCSIIDTSTYALDSSHSKDKALYSMCHRASPSPSPSLPRLRSQIDFLSNNIKEKSKTKVNPLSQRSAYADK